jgi:hypothetical protein
MLAILELILKGILEEIEERCVAKPTNIELKKPLSTILSGFFCEFLHNPS